MDERPGARLRSLAELDDASLVARCRDALAREPELARRICALLWQRHLPLVEVVARRSLRESADEVIADVAVIFCAYVYDGTKPLPRSLPALVRTFVKREVVDQLRRRERRPKSAGWEPEEIAVDDDPLDAALRTERRDELLARVDGRERAMLGGMLDDVPASELASTLGMTANAFYVAWHRLREKLQEMLAQGDRDG